MPAGEGGGVQSSHCQSNHGSQQLDVAFVSLVSGTVSLLLQSLAGGFTGHFTASRQPMATGKSQKPKVAVTSPNLAVADPTADKFCFRPGITLLESCFFHFDTLATVTSSVSVLVCVLGAVILCLLIQIAEGFV